jgi:site-specific DNA recombinase
VQAKTRRRVPSGDPTRAIAYLRVSTTEQANGPEAQRAAVEAWATGRGIEVCAWHEDRGVSGAAPADERPGLLAAFAALVEHGAGCLVVAKRDRVARDVVVAAVVERLAAQHGASLVSADGAGNGEGAEAELMRGILAAFAQFERALIRGRTRAGMAAKRARGERVGAIPLGQRLDELGNLAPDPDEQRVVARVLELHADGMTERGITDALNAEGHPARGARWHRSAVSRLLARARA